MDLSWLFQYLSGLPDESLKKVEEWIAAEQSAPTEMVCAIHFVNEGSIEATVGEWYSYQPNEPTATLLQQADLFTEADWAGKDLGYGIKDEAVTVQYWTVDQDCALWSQVTVKETLGWTPAYNVSLSGVRHF